MTPQMRDPLLGVFFIAILAGATAGMLCAGLAHQAADTAVCISLHEAATLLGTGNSWPPSP